VEMCVRGARPLLNEAVAGTVQLGFSNPSYSTGQNFERYCRTLWEIRGTSGKLAFVAARITIAKDDWHHHRSMAPFQIRGF